MPEIEDIIIKCDGFRFHAGVVEGPFIGTFGLQEDAESAVKDWMKQNNFWPDVWFESDHGNISPYKFD